MEKEKLKELAIAEFLKKVPLDITADEKKARDFVSQNINEALLDKLADEFCAKNPEEGAVLNPFDFTDAEQNAQETVESIDYKLALNHAGLAYKEAEIDAIIAELDTLLGNKR